jgi:thiamine biosynthesis lipoprotein
VTAPQPDWATTQVAIPDRLDVLPSCDPRAAVRTLGGSTMGTTWSVSLASAPDADVGAIRAGVEACLDRVVSEMSTWLDTSDVSRFNRSANEWCDLPDALAVVLACALDVARESGGAYDPTVGPLVNLWGFGPAGNRAAPPREAAVAAARRACGWSNIELDRCRQCVRQPGGVQLDLSAIAKGFAVDAIGEYLTAHGIESYLVEIGGELRGCGVKPNAQPWWVAVEQPPDPAWPAAAQSFELLIALHHLSVATSGDYRKGFPSGGRWYSHTIDPRTGRPVHHAWTSVTVLHRECMVADAWSTALMVLGPQAGLALAEERRIAALFVTRTPAGLVPHATAALVALLR